MQHKILIADDQPENLKLIYIYLKKFNYDIVFAMNGNEVFDRIEDELPDIFLLDINMPEMNGYRVCEKLKQDDRTKDIPVVFVTASNQKDDIIKGLRLGAVDYITKPFVEIEVVLRIQTQLNLYLANRKLKELNNGSTGHTPLSDANYNVVESVMNNSPIGQFLADTNGTLLYANPEFMKMLGHDDGMPYFYDSPEADHDITLPMPNITDGSTSLNFKTLFTDEKGGSVFVRMIGKVITNPETDRKQVVGIIQPV